ncbi:hypothetical protein SFRURICE_002403 [Spodoptera frugiperda]|nr:hypothetical protein SFRURICE_002403 [Spodoptera frugiperda]
MAPGSPGRHHAVSSTRDAASLATRGSAGTAAPGALSFLLYGQMGMNETPGFVCQVHRWCEAGSVHRVPKGGPSTRHSGECCKFASLLEGGTALRLLTQQRSLVVVGHCSLFNGNKLTSGGELLYREQRAAVSGLARSPLSPFANLTVPRTRNLSLSCIVCAFTHYTQTRNNNLWISHKVAPCGNRTRYTLHSNQLPSHHTNHAVKLYFRRNNYSSEEEFKVRVYKPASHAPHTTDFSFSCIETHTTASTDPHRTDRIISNAYVRCVRCGPVDSYL